MRLWPKHWHPETWVCSMRGHAAPATQVVVVGPADAALGAELADGRRLARCLRCDTWIEHAAPAADAARWQTMPAVEVLSKPRRGQPLHEAILMRLIAINKASHAVVFTVLAAMLVVLESNFGRLHAWAQSVADALGSQLGDTGQGASHTWLSRQMRHLLDLQPGTVHVLLLLAVVYAVIEWIEAIGLWKERRWAEYLTVLATAGFLPLEIHELIDRVTVLRVGALIVNVALIVWLVRAKHLFGVRGGPATLHEHVDWGAVLAAPSPAAGRPPQPHGVAGWRRLATRQKTTNAADTTG
ncbi:MAG: DUF2127 domain-containing protein [Ilumatobacteraceae bacterium]